MSSRSRWFSILSLLVLCCDFVRAQSDVSLRNWTVPPYRTSNASGGLSTMADLSPGIGFVAVTPCRIVDTRGGGVFSGTYGPPALVGNAAARPFDINSAPHCPDIPAGAEAYSLNFTIIAAPGSFQNAFLTAWPTGGAQPVVSTLNFNAVQLVANAAIVPVGTNGSIDVFVNAPGHLLIDINGYFTDEYNPGNQFVAVTLLDGGGAILGVNLSTAPGSHGVGGFVPGPGVVHGVQGQVATSASSGSSGVHGINDSTAQHTYGVLGEASAVSGAAGVLGRDRSGTVTGAATGFSSAGVRGESKLWLGVLGISEEIGVLGALQAGLMSTGGFLGMKSGPATYGVYSNGNAHVAGTFTSTNKNFVQPHPSDPSKEIRYVSLEGPQSEIYFRGSAQISRGVTRIPIPDYFRIVATPDSYSALVTPVGAMATVAVLSKGEEGIVVQASRDVRIDYVVYAEREAVRQENPIVENIHFRPDPNIDLLAHLPDSYRQLMVRNGTLNSDGTVNMETAKRLGWDRDWERRARPAPQPAQ